MVILQLPGGGNVAMDGIVTGLCPGKTVTDHRFDLNGFVPGACRPDAAHPTEQIFTAGTERIMIEGIHAGILEAFIRSPAIPALPDSGGTVFHGKQPGGEGVLQQHPIGGVGLARLGQHRQQITHTNKPGGEMVALGLDVRRQVFPSFDLEFRRQQVKLQRHAIGTLGIAGHVPIRRHILPVEGGLDGFKQMFIFIRLHLAANGGAGFGHQMGGIGVVSRRDHILGGIRTDRQPVTVIVAAVLIADKPGAVGLHVFHPFDHRGQMVFQNAFVAVDLVNGPRTDHSGIAPGGDAVAIHGVGIHIGKRPGGGLAVIHVHQPFGEERRDIGIVGRRTDEDLGIPHPAQPFVALRTIGGYTDVVAPLPPLNVRLQLVDARIRTGEFAGSRRVRGDHHSGNGIQPGVCVQAGDFHITESMERETRLPNFLARAFGNVMIHRRRAAQVGGIDGAIVVQHLGVVQGHPGASGGGHLEPDDPHHVLTQIINPMAGFGFGNGFRLQLYHLPHGFHDLRLQFAGRLITNGD